MVVKNCVRADLALEGLFLPWQVTRDQPSVSPCAGTQWHSPTRSQAGQLGSFPSGVPESIYFIGEANTRPATTEALLSVPNSFSLRTINNELKPHQLFAVFSSSPLLAVHNCSSAKSAFKIKMHTGSSFTLPEAGGKGFLPHTLKV